MLGRAVEQEKAQCRRERKRHDQGGENGQDVREGQRSEECSRQAFQGLKNGDDPREIQRRAQPGLEAFMRLRAKYLLY